MSPEKKIAVRRPLFVWDPGNLKEKNETLVSRKKRVFEDFGNFLGDFNSFDIHFSSPQAEKNTVLNV